MKFIIVLFAVIGISCAWATLSYDDVLEAEFETFKLEHSKVYENEEEELLRKQIFKDNKLTIDRHNEGFAAGESTYTMGVNQFTDLLSKEFQALMLSNLNTSDFEASIDFTFEPKNSVTADSIDWRQKGAVTGVKNQGRCGSCWAFSATGTLEGQHFIKHHQLVSLSEQNLVDCSKQNHGCHGGWPSVALGYIHSNNGIDTEQSYHYEGRQTSCRYNRNSVGAHVSKVGQVKRGEDALANVVGSMGPVSVAVDATTFHHYRNGIFNDQSCRRQPNHAVLVVGYGRDYWLIKNSWAESWGERGYMRLARNKNNLCQVANFAVIPFV